MRKIRTEKSVGLRGFSAWLRPSMGKYFLACCDCGLVHEMQFRIEPGTVRPGHGGQAMHVAFRARRAPLYTARRRKEKHPRLGVSQGQEK